ncbi:MAG: diguanylate cyclase [Wenzhouxiangellaceae bacterium]|nr:diguanylate cyclase [Wenzhouxiangellaceae bacterium]
MPLNLDALAAKLPELLLDPLVVVDEWGRFVFVNTACERVLGYSKAELIGQPMIDLVHPDDRERTLAAAARIVQGGSHTNFENRYRHKDGRVVHLAWSARWYESDRLRVAVARDVTALKRSEAARTALYRISEAAHAVESLSALCGVIHDVIDELMPAGHFYMALLDEAGGRLTYPYVANRREPAHESEVLLPGTPLEYVIRSGRPLLKVHDASLEKCSAPEDPDAGGDWLGVPLMAGKRTMGAVVVQTRSPDERYTVDDRDLLQFVSMQVTTAIERMRTQDRLRHMAHHDALTGLPNRLLFYDRFDVAVKRARRGGELLVLLYLDLNHFKKINDASGHHTGDRVLQQVAKRLVDCVRELDTVARMGGDEFTILLNHIGDPGVAEATRKRILKAMAEPFDFGDTTIVLTASIGLAVYPDDGEDIETLLRRADAGMYGMKQPFDA